MYVWKFFQIVFTLLLTKSLLAQNVPDELIYPDTLRSNQGVLYVNSPRFTQIHVYTVDRKKPLNLGTHGWQGVSFTIWTDLDTLYIPHVNYPHEQLVKIPVVSAKDTVLCIFRFQSNGADFNDDYVRAHKNNFELDIPEVYELANVILYLTDCSSMTGNHPNETEYVKQVNEYFKPYLNHKVIQVLNKKCRTGDYWDTYYGFRENSVCYQFNNLYLTYSSPYKNVIYDKADLEGGHFKNLLYLVQDFANKSNFKKFYTEHLSYYNQLKKRQLELLPIRKMWDWLEREFPNKQDSYKIIFSPLIGGSHSTQRFTKGYFREPEFQESVMFINSSEGIDRQTGYSEKMKEGLNSGIVFTEIDHNYVNPMSDLFLKEIKVLMGNKDFWATKETQKNYRSEYAIFNEYMTHSLFCLYISENYEDTVSKQVIDNRIALMERRGFSKFKEFNGILMKLMLNRSKRLYESYGSIINEMNMLR